MESKFLTRKEVMERLKVSKTTVERLEAKRKLIGIQGLGKMKLYLESDVESLLDGLYKSLQERKKAAARLDEIHL